MCSFQLLMKSNVKKSSINSVLENLSKEEIVQQIRTNFVFHTGYCPKTNVINDKITKHVESCPSSKHYFFEVEPLCCHMGTIDGNAVSVLHDDMFKAFHFMKHLSTYGKKEFLNKHLFSIMFIESDSYRFWLEAPYFESNIDKLMDSIVGTGFVKDISLKKYKEHLQQHLTKCNGPCEINKFGLPLCEENETDKELIGKMFAGFYVFINVKSTSVYNKQYLFDMIYKPKQYDNFLQFITMSMMNNNDFKKLIESI